MSESDKIQVKADPEIQELFNGMAEELEISKKELLDRIVRQFKAGLMNQGPEETFGRELGLLQGHFARVQEMFVSLAQRTKDTETQSEQTVQEIRSRFAEKEDSLQTTIDNLRTDLDKQTETLEETAKALSETREHKDQLVSQVETLSSSINVLQKANLRLETELAGLESVREKQASLEQSIATTQTENKKLLALSQEANKTIEAKDKAIKDAEQRRIADLEAQQTRLQEQAELAEGKALLQQAKDYEEKLARTREEGVSRVLALSQDLDNARGQIESLREQREEYRKEIHRRDLQQKEGE